MQAIFIFIQKTSHTDLVITSLVLAYHAPSRGVRKTTNCCKMTSAKELWQKNQSIWPLITWKKLRFYNNRFFDLHLVVPFGTMEAFFLVIFVLIMVLFYTFVLVHLIQLPGLFFTMPSTSMLQWANLCKDRGKLTITLI